MMFLELYTSYTLYASYAFVIYYNEPETLLNLIMPAECDLEQTTAIVQFVNIVALALQQFDWLL